MGLISRVSSRTYRKSKQKRPKKSTNMVQAFINGSQLYQGSFESEQELRNFVAAQENCTELNFYCNGEPLNFANLEDGNTITVVGKLLGGKVHGSLARAGKVKGQTPKVDPEEKKKKKTGRAKRRMLYNRRFVNIVPTFGKRRGPNSNS